MSTGTKVFLGILGAAAAGVVIGMLLAPDKGSETRKRIAKTAGNWTDQLTNLFNHGREQYDELKEKAKNLKSNAQEKVSRMKEDLA